jgi:biotin transport system substrate-specific component
MEKVEKAEKMGGKTALTAKRKTLAEITLTALFAALTAAGAVIAIPLPFSPVPIVLQNFFALLAGLLLGPLLGSAALALYLIAGALGAPVFAGTAGGIARFLSPTGGFLAGYFLAALSAGLIAGRPGNARKTPLFRIILAVTAGLTVIYVPGLIWFKTVLGRTWGETFFVACAPFIPGDLVKAFIAALIAPRLRRAVADQLER